MPKLSALCLLSGNKKRLKQGVSCGHTHKTYQFTSAFGLLDVILWESQWLDKLCSHTLRLWKCLRTWQYKEISVGVEDRIVTFGVSDAYSLQNSPN